MTREQLSTECNIISKVSEKLLKQVPTKNPIDIAKYLGVTIRYIDSKTVGFIVKGEYFKDTTIYINKNLDNY